MANADQEGLKPEVYIAGSNFSSSNFFKKPLFLIPALLIILILTLAILNYFNILPLSKLLSPFQTPTKGKALHPEEPILLPTPSSSSSSTSAPANAKPKQNIKLK